MYHQLATAYGWTPQQVDECDAELIDWMLAIQGVEAEIREEQQKKHDRQMRHQQQNRQPRRRF